MKISRKLLLVLFMIIFKLVSAQFDLDTLSFNYNSLPENEKAELLKDVGLGYVNLNDYSKALDYFNSALKIYKSTNDESGLSDISNHLGTIHNKLGTYEKALEFHFESLRIDEKLQNKQGIAQSLNNIGIVYQNLKKYAESLEYYNHALQINYEIDDLDAASKTLNNLGNILLSLENFSQALSYYQRSLTLKEELENEYGKAITLNNIGMAYQGLNSFNQAMQNFEMSLQIMKNLNDSHGMASSYYHIGLLYYQQNNYSSAQNYLDSALSYAIMGNELNIQKNCYNLLARIHASRNEFEQAYNSFKMYVDMKDALFTEQNNRNITEMKIRYETEKKETEINLLQKTADLQNFMVKRQQIYLIIFVVGFVILAVLAFYGYAQYRLKSRSYKIIEDQNKQLKEVNDQIRKLSKTDALTKLLTKQDILEKINYEVVRFKRNKKTFVLALCDIDNLQSINDRFTTDCGDLLLRSIAELVRKRLRSQDHIARWTGGSFLILLPDTDLAGAKVAAEKIRREIKNFEMIYGRYTVKSTATIGISSYASTEDMETCLKNADKALHYGKKNHKNCVVAFEELK
ncbi:MAG: GGDEF domain-containing protein [Candidatus Cloacimonetes bacterium]|nr:GGDEF domain-containing protein [Candidatus Cloacimonadota bacterium]